MSRSAATLGIRPNAIPAWLSLSEALERMTDNGRTPVCTTRPEQWSSDAPEYERSSAAEACGWCPAMAPCRAFAQSNEEKAGVWGARDFTPITRRKAA